jgi:hypothetical protein
LENPKAWMLLASIMGASVGIYYTSGVNPLNNYFIFLALFVVIGVGVGNVVLLVLYKVYVFLKQYYVTAEGTQNQQTA